MDVGDWLRKLGLEQYAAAFRDNAIDSSVLPGLTAEDLKDLGVTLVGHRRRLLDAIGALGQEAVCAPSAAPIPAAAAEAERRQLTVLFCDLAGSTELAARLDPEDLRAIINAYHQAVAAVLTGFGGFVAKYMGDGILAYFGYPQAHEEDCERAVRAGLAIVDAVSGLDLSEQLAVRIGIATGLVVVGDLIGAGAAQEQAVVGETPNLAARLQGLAAPNAIVIADATRRQIGSLFEIDDLGPQALKGFAAGQRVWRVVGESGVASRFEALRSGATPLVGRDEEIDLLLRRWAQAKAGEGRVVLISAEPGIGKSRLAEALEERIAAEPHTRLRYFCSPHHQDSALHPVIGQLERTAGFNRDDSAATKQQKLAALLAESPPDELSLVAELLSLPAMETRSELELTPQRRKEQTFEALLGGLERLSRRTPVLMLFEDLHWMDPTSRELLDRTIARVERLPVLLVATFRPEYQPPWTGQPHVTMLALNRLGRRDGALLVAQLVGNAGLPADLIDEIVERTDGVPLFLEEVTKVVIETAAGSDAAARGTLAAIPGARLAVPATLQASLMARLDRLGPVPKEIAQIGAAIGREFPYELLSAVAPHGESETQAALARLVAAGLVFQRGTPPTAEYQFKHALVQDTAYGMLLRGPRQALHARVADAIEAHSPETAETQPELVAFHYTEAGLEAPAIVYWRRAGERAAKRAANIEAIEHLRRGLALLESLPERGAHAEEELRLLIALGPALMSTMTTAAPEIQDVYGRARQLARDTGKVAELFATVWGSWLVANTKGNREAALNCTAELFSIARDQNNPGYLLQAHHCAWPMEMAIGNIRAAHEHAEAGLPLYSKAMHRDHAVLYGGHDPAVCGYLSDSGSLQMLGQPDRSLVQLDQGLALARELAHPPSLIHALGFGAETCFLRRDPGRIVTLVADWLPLVSRYSSTVGVANAMMTRGWALVMLGEREAGLAELRDGLDRWRSTGSKFFGPVRFGRAVEAFLEMGQVGEATALLGEAFDVMASTSERWFEAELHRLKGLVLAAGSRDQQPEAAASFQRAIDVARSQGARLFELRAAMALCRQQGDPEESQRRYALLASVYRRFTEGFETPDLVEAKALLAELA